ncbi:MAG: 1,4-alpha-glucan branching protein GlgB [Dehalococcoidia bacterium]
MSAKNIGESAQAPAVNVRYDFSLLTDDDVYLFNEGNHLKLYEKLGSHLAIVDGIAGVYFAVWAPNARGVSVIGDFNGWERTSHPLRARGSSGIWEGFVPGAGTGTNYKYWIESTHAGYKVAKADPFAIHAENSPKTASIVWDRDYQWADAAWMSDRARRNALDAPMSTYELHVGSWRRAADDRNRWLSYRELAPQLAEYIKRLGFTHVELMPIMEHPFYGSWGYQVTGFFAPTSRYGTPQDFAYLVDYLHQQGIGVILDWVPSHFPDDEHGLAYFDGTHLFEHEDPRQGYHPDWNSYIFNYGRNEVRSFLLSSAMYWLEQYHLDGLRVDAVASMLYLDYSRKPGEWIPNKYGGRENLDAVEFLRRFNVEAYGHNQGIQTIAEESTAWGGVTRPAYLGGLGFGLKWDMGWMNDTLKYLAHDPVYRKFHHGELTFRMLYAFTENFVLALSHDEVVHGKGSLISKMPGDDWQQAANLRLLLAYMYSQPGKKLLFMGGEFGQWKEWDHESTLDWAALESEFHKGIQQLTADLNAVYQAEPALHQLDLDRQGFEWIDANDAEGSALSWIRKARDGALVLIACNFTPVPRQNYRVGVPLKGAWREILNTDAHAYGGSGQGNLGEVRAAPIPIHGRPYSLNLTLPPLAAIFLKHDETAG